MAGFAGRRPSRLGALRLAAQGDGVRVVFAAIRSDSDLRYLVIVERDRDVLRLHVEVEGIVAAVAADAGGFGAAERRRQMPHVLRIDPHHAGLDALRETVRAADVLGPKVGGEPVAYVIGDRQRFLLVGERDHREYRPEDLFLRDLHGVARSEIERRRYEITFLARSPTADDCRAFLFGGFDIGQDFVDVPGVDQRANFGRGIERMADLDGLHARGGAPGK